MKLIVGLGNPGDEYKETRHNVGFLCIDEIAKYYSVKLDSKKFNGLYTSFICNSEKVMLLKPLKYMNLSGEVIRDFINFYKISIEDLLIIYDDIYIEMGFYKLRYQGSNAGHNGLKDIERNLLTKNYKRIKIGISKNSKIDMKEYVTGKMSKEEQKEIYKVIIQIPNIINDYLNMSFDNLMNKYN